MSSESSASSARPPAIVWLRNDLRLHDHEPLQAALANHSHVLLLYCVDPRQFSTLAIGVPKTGPFRARFLIESLEALRTSVRSAGGELAVRTGEPETVVADIAREINATHVYFHHEPAPEERRVENALIKQLQAAGVKTRFFFGHTMVHHDDLPYPVAALPDTFSKYRNAVERRVTVREPLPAPSSFRSPNTAAGDMPTLASLGLTEPARDARTLLHFRGGEQEGLARLHDWMWDADQLKTYKTTRNGLLATNDSSKFSPWLALGCLSPRTVYAEVQRYERTRVRNEDTGWLVFELHWRDYFRWVAAKWGARLYAAGGLQGLRYPWRDLRDHDAHMDFNRWAEGTTGFPLVDAAMRELAATGYTSNRARQNVASFLTRVLGVDWRSGAQWFESLLVDYDVGSNWGNWAYVAGVGNDARGFRFFNVHKQAGNYDADGAFARHWLPELAHIPGGRIYRPDQLSTDEQQRYGVALGDNYPEPMVNLFAAADASSVRYDRAVAATPQS